MCEVETQFRRMDNNWKEKRRKFEKLLNWGELISIQEEEDQPHGEKSGQIEEWLVSTTMAPIRSGTTRHSTTPVTKADETSTIDQNNTFFTQKCTCS